MQEYDLIIKALVERYASHFAHFVRGVPLDRVERLEKEAVAVRRDSDVLLGVSENGYEYVMLIEVQTRPDPEMPRRLLEYTAMQHREWNRHIYPVVLNLTGTPQASGYGFNCLELPVVSFRYRVINLAELPGEAFLERGSVGLAPLALLMQRRVPAEEMVARCVKRIREAPAGWIPDLYVAMAVFSRLAKIPDELIRKYIEVSVMEASPLFDEIRDKWIQKGKIEQREEGIRWVQDNVLDALEANLGGYPEEVSRQVREIRNVDELKKLHRVAVKAKNIAEFEFALKCCQEKS